MTSEFAKKEQWDALNAVLRRLGVEPPASGERACVWVDKLTEDLTKIADRLDEARRIAGEDELF